MNHVVCRPRVLPGVFVAVGIGCVIIPHPTSARLIPAKKGVANRPERRGPEVSARRRKRRRARPHRRARSKRRAKRYFRRAERRFSEAKYNEALALYDKAYQSWPVPALLFNIGQCYRKLGQYEKAIEIYQKYLSKAKSRRRRRIVRRVLRQTRELLAAQKGQRTTQERVRQITSAKDLKQRRDLVLQLRKLENERRVLEEKRRRIEVELRAREEMLRRLLRISLHPESRRLLLPTGQPSPTDRPRKKAQRAPFYKKWWFWTSIAVGVAAAVGTGVGVALWPREKTVFPSGSLGTYDRR